MRRAVMLCMLALPCAMAHAAEPLSAFSWLQGCWAVEGAEPGTGEQWSAPAGGTMLGFGRTVRKGRTAQYEFLQLRETEGKITYIALPSGQRETAFTLQHGTTGEAVFENLAHDFPQRIIYRRTPGPGLHARIEGMVQGKLKTVEFPMKRVSCEA